MRDKSAAQFESQMGILQDHHRKYIDSKQFLVDAHDEDRHFFAWVNPDGTVTSVEILPGNWPWITVCTEADMKTWVKSITWHEWIREGVQYDELEAMIQAEEWPEKEEEEEDDEQ